MPEDFWYVVRRAQFCKLWGITWEAFDSADQREIALIENYAKSAGG